MSYRIAFIGYGLRSKVMLSAFRNLEAGVEAAAVCEPNPEAARADTEAVIVNASIGHIIHSLHHGQTAQDAGGYDTLHLLDNGAQPQGKGHHHPVLLSPSGVCQGGQLRLADGDRLLQKEGQAAGQDFLGHRGVQGAPGTDEYAVGTALLHNVPYGSVYYHSWYRNSSLTGGLFLQKATHDIDYISYLIGETPVQAYAQTAKLYFKGNRPAGLRCPDCPDYRTCPESSYVVERIQKDDVQGDACCFAVDTGNEDNACAIFTCPSGLLISYSQSFVVREEFRYQL